MRLLLIKELSLVVYALAGTPGRATPARTPAMPSSPGNEPQAESGGTILEDDLGESILPELEDQLEMEPEDDSFPASQEMDADNLEDALEEQCVEGNGVGMDILGEGMNAPYGHVNEF